MLYTFFNITSDNITQIVSYVSTLIDETKPIWLLIMGVLLGLIVLEVIVNAIRNK